MKRSSSLLLANQSTELAVVVVVVSVIERGEDKARKLELSLAPWWGRWSHQMLP